MPSSTRRATVSQVSAEEREGTSPNYRPSARLPSRTAGHGRIAPVGTRRIRRVREWARTLWTCRGKYQSLFGRRMHLLFPRTHSERIQHLKFLRRDPRIPVLTDKIESKKYIAARVGEQYVIPTYWQGPR